MTNLGMIRTAAVSPMLKVGNTQFNSDEILRCAEEAYKEGAGIIVFPALCLTGASCGDLFFQDALYKGQLEALNKIALSTQRMSAALVLGIYLRLDNRLVQCAALLQYGLILGIVPRYLPSGAKGTGENRWFSPGTEIESTRDFVTLFGNSIPFGKIVFRDSEKEIALGIELDEDMSGPVSPGAELCLAGAHILCNPAASPELIGSAAGRRYRVLQKSKDCLCGYVYTSAGACESSSDTVYSGHCLIAESGTLLKEDSRLSFGSKLTFSDVDYEALINQRAGASGFSGSSSESVTSLPCHSVHLDPLSLPQDNAPLMRTWSKTPFIPANKAAARQNSREAFEIQSTALARRLSHTGANKVVLGISGGLDSTMALLVSVRAMKLLDKPASGVITVTMPGFGTTGKTYSNAMAMMEALGTEIREIPIKESVLLHFRDIGHDPAVQSAVYENAQARERTQILMDIANMENGIHVGTGDLSEEALGWCTYNGDHMAMYNVNSAIPKTFLRVMVRWFIDCVLTGQEQAIDFSGDNVKLEAALQGVLDTPVSPELLPPEEDGSIAQKTEDKVGPYELHDFFVYHTVRSGPSPARLLAMAKSAFADDYEEDFILHWLKVFYSRFFSQQFKRSCAPDGPKVGTVSLSIKGDWQMPSDADSSVWLADLPELKK